MKNAHKILLAVLMLALAISVFAVAALAAEETPNADGSVTTEYGTFTPTAEQTATAYPLVVFKPDKTVKGLYTTWKAALDEAVKINNSVVYLRADVTRATGEAHVESLTAKTVSLTIDLNGHILTKADKLLFSNYPSSATETKTSVTFKNGTLVQGNLDGTNDWRAFFNYDYHKTNHKAPVNMNYTFDNVKFIDDRDSVASQKVFIFAISEYDVAEMPYQVTGKIVYNNCEFYSRGCYIFAGATSNDYSSNIDVSIEVNGGKVQDSSGLSKDKLSILSTFGDSLVFGAYNGSYTEFVCPTSLAPTSDILLRDDTGAERILTKKGEDGENTVYELVSVVEGEGVEVTPYTALMGLSGDKADTTKYPLAVFKKNGNLYTLIDVYSTWKAAADVAVGYNGAVIYFRADVTRPTGEGGRDLDGKKISITVDLNGKTLTKSDTYIFDIYLRNTTTNSHVTFKNGTIAQGSNDGGKSRGFISYNYSANHTVADANIDFTFENVNLKDERTTNREQFIITVNEGGNGSAGVKKTYGDITLNNCVIYPKANASYIFNAYDSGNNVNLAYTVNGGKIVATQEITAAKLIRINGGSDSVVFGDYEGAYTKFLYPTSVNISNSIQVTDNYGNTRALAKSGTDGSNAIYVLGELTEYGAIGSEALASEAPFAVFKDNGNETYTFTKVYATWLSALNDARTMNSVVYLRSNVTRPAGEAGPDLDGYTSNIVVDLNGKTLTKADKLIFDIYFDTSKATKVNVTFKNGTLAQQECATDWRAFIQYNYGSAHSYDGAVINFTFENVRIEDNRTSHDNNSGFIIVSGGGGTNSSGAKSVTGAVTFNNCEIYTKGIIPVKGKDDQNKIDITCVMNGGKIVSSKNVTSASLFNSNSDKDTFKFGKYNGKYTSVELTDSATIDNSVWNTTEGIECVFVPGGESYNLYPSVMLDYKIKTSVTLWSNFVYNVYLPIDSFNSVAVNGKTAEYTEVEIEGIKYNLVKIVIPVYETLDNIVLNVTLNSGEATVSAKWTLSVYNYTKNILEGNYSTVEKQLMKDMLVYASAAHTYFEKTET